MGYRLKIRKVLFVIQFFSICLWAQAKEEGQNQQETVVLQHEQSSSGSRFTDPRDRQTYRTVKIGNQTWMAQNLNYETGNSWCYDNAPSNCQQYGRLYDWETAKTACPSGWHTPTNDEWDVLVNTVGGEDSAGILLKSKTDWLGNGNGSDNYGFSALPGGCYYGWSSFNRVGYNGLWWTATEYSSTNAYNRLMNDNDADVASNYLSKTFGYSLRCVEDTVNNQPEHKVESKLNEGTGDTLAAPPGGEETTQVRRKQDIDMGAGGSSRSVAEIMATVRARTPGLRHIYNKYLKSRPGFSGKIILNFTIAPSGDIISIKTVSSTTGYDVFDSEIQSAVSRWRFDAVNSGKTTVTIPFSFEG